MRDPPASPESRAADGELRHGNQSTWKRWLLLEGKRNHVVLGTLAVISLVNGALLLSGVVAVRHQGPLTRLFSSFVGGNLTLITVAISINQLILSREFATPDELRDRVHDAMAYRHEVEEAAGAEVSPVTPDEFIDFLAEEVASHADDLREATPETVDRDCRSAVETYAETLAEQADQITTTLGEGPTSAFDALLVILDTDFTSDLYRAERLRTACGDSLPAAATDRLEDVFELLQYTGVARQYFKVLYMQRELAALSQRILFTGVPAVATSTLAVWLYGHPSGAAVPSPVLELVVLVATVVALAPLAVLISYVLRITTITRRTASLLPFKIAEESPL